MSEIMEIADNGNTLRSPMSLAGDEEFFDAKGDDGKFLYLFAFIHFTSYRVSNIIDFSRSLASFYDITEFSPKYGDDWTLLLISD
jgi:hypothetical protein